MRRLHVDHLPGCIAYTNERAMRVRQKHDAMRLIDFLEDFHPPTPRADWQRWIAAGDITLASQRVTQDQPVRCGQRYVHVQTQYVEPPVNATIGVLFEDEALIVVDKPAPLPVHPSGRFNRNTLAHLMAMHFPGERLRIAHRLDANTTGVVVFCRTGEAAAFVQPQFEQRRVAKHYLTRVVGHVPWDETHCRLPIGEMSGHAIRDEDRRPGVYAGTGGSRAARADGRAAETIFRTLSRLPDQSSLLQCVPITGRTNQIRVHASELGFPVMGDPMYGSVAVTPTLGLDDPPMCLHAWKIQIIHPHTRQPVWFESSLPSWASPLSQIER